uniref:Uncharacterized protein n=1 Tax=Setaria viridis TaxID=4556 RepID=A0A4U6T3W2_SETVI|nr:hypothetical protein SEVIR_9G310300v2 [Setaria viridis]
MAPVCVARQRLTATPQCPTEKAVHHGGENSPEGAHSHHRPNSSHRFSSPWLAPGRLLPASLARCFSGGSRRALRLRPAYVMHAVAVVISSSHLASPG